MTLPEDQLRQQAIVIFEAALRAVDPETCVRRFLQRAGNTLRAGGLVLDLATFDRVLVIGAGKASAAMAQATEAILGDHLNEGLVVTKYGHGTPLCKIRLREAGHPIPDGNGMQAAQEMLEMLAGANERTLVLCLLSGGGSALLPLPVMGIELADKQTVSRLLLKCGADISEINTLRKHLSRIKGGGLCAAAGDARLLSLILSDVIGDDPQVIASGPTAPDSTSFADCFAILDRYGLWD